MGSGKPGFNVNRSEFVADNDVEGVIQYERGGGCFVTTKKVIVLVIIAIITLIAVSILIYLFGSKNGEKQEVYSLLDIEKLLNHSLNINGEDTRLPLDLQPLYYRLRIHPYLEEPNTNNFTFTGQITILLQCVQSTNKIIFHSEDLEIFEHEVTVATNNILELKPLSQVVKTPDTHVALNNDSNVHVIPTQSQLLLNNRNESPIPSSLNRNNFTLTEDELEKSTSPSFPSIEYTTLPNSIYQVSEPIYISIKKLEKVKATSTYIVHLSSVLSVEKNYTLEIKFSGQILDNLVGLYKSSYLDVNKQQRWFLTTQLQPTFARRVFPCFDEPSFKSVFEISIARRTNMTVVSNMPLKQSEPMFNNSSWVWDHFEKSPPMSTHLIAFTISDFEFLKVTSTGLAPVFKIWAPKHMLISANYITEIGSKIFIFLENYFGFKYPLTKIDLIYIPEMSLAVSKNLGIIFFRDTALLTESDSNHWKYKNRIFKTIAGILTKQWFGNLITMDWWSDIWLIESFSIYMEDVIEKAIEPTLANLDTFFLRITTRILDSDKLNYMHSVNQGLSSSNQFEKLLNDDALLYKGSCLIRMLKYTITEPIFKAAIQNFFKKWMYKSSTLNDFWNAITEIENTTIIPSDINVSDFMNSWIQQEGYPIITVNRDYLMGTANINQIKFVNGNESSHNLWYIPLTYTKQSESSVVYTTWMREQYITVLNITQPNNTEWVIFNIDGSGLYRVNYDERNWKLLTNQLLSNPNIISPTNRAQLLSDGFELAYLGVLNYRIAFELTKYLKYDEYNYIPWYSLFNSLKPLQYIIAATPKNGIFERYILKLIKPVYHKLGTLKKSNDTLNEKFLRSFIVNVACSMNYEPCLEWAKKQYRAWMTSSGSRVNPIPTDFQETVQCTSIRIGGAKEWTFLWKKTLNSSVSSSDLKIMYLSLGCTHEPWLLNSYLEHSLNGNIAIENLPYVWKSISHPAGLRTGLIFLRTNWSQIYNTYQHIFSNFNSIFNDFLSKLSTAVELDDLMLFYQQNKKSLHPVSSLMLNVVDKIKWRISWVDLHMETVTAWLLYNN